MRHQRADRVVAAVAVDHVVVEVAEHHELRIGGQPAAAAGVVAQPARLAAAGIVQVLAPQPQFVVVACGVALLRAVEHRRGRVRHQCMQHAQRGAHRHVPVRLGRQPQLRPHRVAVEEAAGGRIDRAQRVGHRAPFQQAEAAHRRGIDRVLRQQQHAVLAGMQAVAPGVVAARAAFAADMAVVVQVQAAGHAGVDRGQVAVGIAQRSAAVRLRHREVALLEQVGGAVRLVVVELVEQHDVRAHLLQHRGDLARLRAVALQGGDQRAGFVGIERGVVGGQAQRPGGGRCGVGHRGGRGSGVRAGAAQ
ncbi:hypothetical protein NB689_003069 [Xanthomonas sacchari]|nr:hypothetical protein [Xanthomonas sacchari]